MVVLNSHSSNQLTTKESKITAKLVAFAVYSALYREFLAPRDQLGRTVDELTKTQQALKSDSLRFLCEPGGRTAVHSVPDGWAQIEISYDKRRCGTALNCP